VGAFDAWVFTGARGIEASGRPGAAGPSSVERAQGVWELAKSELTGIGPWRLVEALGAGERATVYRAHDAGAIGAQARPMAVKVLHGVLAQDPATVEAFVERAKVHQRLSRLDHPAIVRCHAVESAGGRPFAVLELEDAMSLERLFPERGRAKFSVEAAANVLVGVLDALAAAANDKVVHGRLGPSDVLVHADGSVAVTGFGQNGDLRMDFLALHRLAQRLNAAWPPEVDAWLDALASERSAWKDARGARAAFPLAFSEVGQKALDRSVKNRRRRDIKALEAAAATAEEPEEEIEEEADEAPGESSPRRRARVQTPMAVRREEAEAALAQARVVAFSALAIVLVALVMEVFGFSA